MKEFYINKELPSVSVNKKLIEQIEEYILNDIPNIIGVDKEKVKEVYVLEIIDSLGVEKFNKISDYPLSIFQNGTSKISFGFSVYEDIYATVKISFGVKKYTSELIIKLKTQNAREKAHGIYNGILDRIKPNKTYNSYFHTWVNGPILGLGIIMLMPSLALFLNDKILWGVYSLFGGISLISFSSKIEKIKPYSEFETQRQMQLNKIFSFLIWGLISYIIFGVGLGLLYDSITK